MAQIHIGFSVSQLNAAIRTRCDCAEISLKNPVPSSRTLRRWRSEVGDDFPISLRWVISNQTQKNQYNLSTADEKRAWLKLVTESAQHLDATAIVVENTPELRPTPKNKELLRSTLQEVEAMTKRHVIWKQNGLWEPSHLREIRENSNLALCSDPLQTETEEASTKMNQLGYSKIKQIGTQQKLSDSTTRELITRLRRSNANSHFLIIEGANPGPLCKRLRLRLADPDTLL